MPDEQIMQAAQICRENGLPIKGIHFHQGSQFRDPAPLAEGIEKALDLAAEIGFKGEWHLSPGGGWGMAYHEDDLPHPPIEEYVRFVTQNIKQGAKWLGWISRICTWNQVAAWWRKPGWQSIGLVQ